MKKLAILIIAAIMLLMLQSCGNSSGSGGSGSGGLKGEKIDNYSVKIVYNGNEIKNYSMEDINKLPVTKFELAGSTEEGPSLSSLLKANNINDYSKVTFIGIWKDSLTLTKKEVEAATILDITNHGTVKLATKAINKNKWIKDIITVKVAK